MREKELLSSLNKLEQTAAETADFLLEKIGKLEVEIFAHGDADGVASSLLLATFLRLRDVPFRLTFTGPFGAKDMIRLAESQEKKKLMVFLDQGGSEVDTIQRSLLETGHQVVIIDHHQGQPLTHASLSYLNPHLVGMDGGLEISAAGLTYLVVERLERSMRRLGWLAVVGALGDRQEIDGRFIGANQLLVQRMLDEGLVKKKTGLRLTGRNGSLLNALCYSVKPYLPGISGNEELCLSILKQLGLDRSATFHQVDEEKLLEAILSRCPDPEKFRKMLWGPLYHNHRYLHEEAIIAQACGMMERPAVAFGRLAGDSSLETLAWSTTLEYAKKILSALQWISFHRDSLKNTPVMRYLHVPVEASMAGELLSVSLESGILPSELPVIALVDSGTQIKVSGRVSHTAQKRYNIGVALSMSARIVGGAGGGHEAAGAAYIPKNKLDIFLSKLEEFLSGQNENRGETGVAGEG